MRMKGIVFSLDAVFALYIVLILMTTFVALLHAASESSQDQLVLSRLARDAYEVKRAAPSASLPMKEGDDCANAGIAGAAEIIQYSQIGGIGYAGIKVTSQVVCE